jgi:hypothetical protein
MSTGSQTAKVQVEVEARTDAAVTNFEKLQSSTKKSREEVEKIEKASTRAASALRPLTTATEKQAAASSKASGTALALGKAVDTAKGGTTDLVRATLAATASFGPLGIAAGAAGTAVYNLGEEMLTSADNARELRKQLELQKKVLDNQYAFEVEESQEQEKIAAHRRRRKLIEYQEDTAGLAIRRKNLGEIMELEKKVAAGGRGASAAQSKIAELRAINAETQKEYDAAREIRHEDELRVIALKNQKRAKQELRGMDLDADAKLSKSFMGPNMGRSLAGQMEDDVIARETQVAQQAKLAADFKHDLDVRAANDEEYRENARQERFEREMQRIRDEQEARSAAAEAAMAAGTMIADSAASIAQAYLTSGDLSAKGFRKAVGQFATAEAIRLTVVAIRETVLGGVAASNPFTAALAAGHFAAAGQAAAGAATLGAMALALGAAGGGGGMTKNVAGLSGAAFGPGTVAANDRPSVSNSQKDTTPVSASEDAMRRSNSAAAGGSSTGGGQVIHIGSIHVLGAIDETAARKIAQGIKNASGRDGRLTG